MVRETKSITQAHLQRLLLLGLGLSAIALLFVLLAAAPSFPSLAAHNSNLHLHGRLHHHLELAILIPYFRYSRKDFLMKESSWCARQNPSRKPTYNAYCY